MEAIPLRQYINTYHDGNVSEFARATGRPRESLYPILRSKKGVVIDGVLCVPVTCKTREAPEVYQVLECSTLQEYIDKHYGGVVLRFAKDTGHEYQYVYRLVNEYEVYVVGSTMYRPQGRS